MTPRAEDIGLTLAVLVILAVFGVLAVMVGA
jgi:hypothetical protein